MMHCIQFPEHKTFMNAAHQPFLNVNVTYIKYPAIAPFFSMPNKYSVFP